MGRAIRISYRWERTWYISTICAASRILRVVRRVTGEQINGGGRSFRSSSRRGRPASISKNKEHGPTKRKIETRGSLPGKERQARPRDGASLHRANQRP